MHNQRKIVLILAIAGMAGTFLPWATIGDFMKIDGTAGDGYITLGLFAVCAIVAFLGKMTYPVKTVALLLGFIVPALLAVTVAVMDMLRLQKSADKTTDLPYEEMFKTHVGYGIYLIIAAGAAIAILSVLLNKKP